jgi:hypothetical protein
MAFLGVFVRFLARGVPKHHQQFVICKEVHVKNILQKS